MEQSERRRYRYTFTEQKGICVRIARYLFQHKFALLMVVAMFVLQAICDLALPAYTSDIVDVGIQQSGIPDAVPEELSPATHDALAAQLAGDDAALFDASYAFEGSRYVYRHLGKMARETLSDALVEPLIRISGGVPADEPGMRLQQAVSVIHAEYEALGVDITSKQVKYLLHMGLMMLLMVVLACIFHIIMNFFATRAGATIARDLRRKLFAAVVGYSQTEIGSFSAASLITRGTNDIQQIQMTSMMMQRMLTYSVIIAIGGIIRVAQSNVSMSWIIGLAVILVIITMVTLVSITMPKFKIMQKLVDKVNLVSREALSGVSVVRAFNRQSFEEDRFEKASTDLMRTQLFTARAMSFMGPILTLILNGVSVLIVWVGARYVDLGTVQTGDLIAFITYSMMIIGAFLAFGMIAIILPRAEVAAQRVNEVIATASSVVDPEHPEDEAFIAETAKQDGLEIIFDKVSFVYPEAASKGEPEEKRHLRKRNDSALTVADRIEGEEAPQTRDAVLSGLNFTIHAGETCAIVGGTGSGKSTLLKLILRFFDVTEGAIRVNGHDVRNLSQETLRQTLAFVPQQTYLFDGTIASNVSFGCNDDDGERVRWALDVAQAADFVAEKDGGVEAEVAQGGSNFSGGQRQRLAIARALATDAKAFLFDDSFSALDYRTDSELRRRLARDLAGRTVIIVAQRIATVMNADKIIVLDEGRMVGMGTHVELMETCGAYREIALSQLSEEELAKGVR